MFEVNDGTRKVFSRHQQQGIFLSFSLSHLTALLDLVLRHISKRIAGLECFRNHDLRNPQQISDTFQKYSLSLSEAWWMGGWMLDTPSVVKSLSLKLIINLPSGCSSLNGLLMMTSLEWPNITTRLLTKVFCVESGSVLWCLLDFDVSYSMCRQTCAIFYVENFILFGFSDLRAVWGIMRGRPQHTSDRVDRSE